MAAFAGDPMAVSAYLGAGRRGARTFAEAPSVVSAILGTDSRGVRAFDCGPSAVSALGGAGGRVAGVPSAVSAFLGAKFRGGRAGSALGGTEGRGAGVDAAAAARAASTSASTLLAPLLRLAQFWALMAKPAFFTVFARTRRLLLPPAARHSPVPRAIGRDKLVARLPSAGKTLVPSRLVE